MNDQKFAVKIIHDPATKSTITEHILRSLPQWFGIESSLLEYVEGVKKSTYYVAYDGDLAVGFISLIYNNPHTAEIYVTGILPKYHRCGIGRTLMAICESQLIEDHYRFLMVKTLSDSHSDPHYALTRQFYEAMDFYPLEELPTLWGEANPCLIMVKSLTHHP